MAGYATACLWNNRAVELEHALDALYDATPDDFVAERKRLAKELKAAGQRRGRG